MLATPVNERVIIVKTFTVSRTVAGLHFNFVKTQEHDDIELS